MACFFWWPLRLGCEGRFAARLHEVLRVVSIWGLEVLLFVHFDGVEVLLLVHFGGGRVLRIVQIARLSPIEDD